MANEALLAPLAGAIKWVVIAGAVGIAFRLLGKHLLEKLNGSYGKTEAHRYVAVNHVASPPEKVLYERLCRALPELIVLAQVHLPRVVQPASRAHAPLNKIIRKSLDFMICDGSFRPLVAIEVNDRSHDAGHRIAADNDKAAALESAGVPLIKWEARKLPSVETIRITILQHVKIEAEEPAAIPTPKPAKPRTRLAPDQPT